MYFFPVKNTPHAAPLNLPPWAVAPFATPPPSCAPGHTNMLQAAANLAIPMLKGHI